MSEKNIIKIKLLRGKMSYNFYANILEGRGNQDMVDARYVEGGSKVDKKIGFIKKEEAEQLYGISTPFMNFVFQTYLVFKKNNGNNNELISVIKQIIPYLAKYDKTSGTFPIKNFNKDDVFNFVKKEYINNVEEILNCFIEREKTLEVFNKFPSVAKNNGDIKYGRNLDEMKKYGNKLKNILEIFLGKLKSISLLPTAYAEKRKKEVIGQIFSENNDTDAWEEEIRNTEKVAKFKRDELKEFINGGILSDTKIITETKNYTFLEVSSYEDMTLLGCHSKWCVARQNHHWKSLIEDGRKKVYVLINWQKDDRKSNFMHIISDPFMKNGEIFYYDYGQKGFADMDNEMLKSEEEIEEVWLPFKEELSKKEYAKILDIDTLDISLGSSNKSELTELLSKISVIETENYFLVNMEDVSARGEVEKFFNKKNINIIYSGDTEKSNKKTLLIEKQVVDPILIIGYLFDEGNLYPSAAGNSYYLMSGSNIVRHYAETQIKQFLKELKNSQLEIISKNLLLDKNVSDIANNNVILGIIKENLFIETDDYYLMEKPDKQDLHKIILSTLALREIFNTDKDSVLGFINHQGEKYLLLFNKSDFRKPIILLDFLFENGKLKKELRNIAVTSDYDVSVEKKIIEIFTGQLNKSQLSKVLENPFLNRDLNKNDLIYEKDYFEDDIIYDVGFRDHDFSIIYHNENNHDSFTVIETNVKGLKELALYNEDNNFIKNISNQRFILILKWHLGSLDLDNTYFIPKRAVFTSTGLVLPSNNDYEYVTNYLGSSSSKTQRGINDTNIMISELVKDIGITRFDKIFYNSLFFRMLSPVNGYAQRFMISQIENFALYKIETNGYLNDINPLFKMNDDSICWILADFSKHYSDSHFLINYASDNTYLNSKGEVTQTARDTWKTFFEKYHNL